MTFSDISNIIGILLLMYAGCLGTFSSFSEKDEDIVKPSDSPFEKVKFYKTKVAQKYFNIVSSFGIIIGSFFLLLPYIIVDELINQEVPHGILILGMLIIILILVLLKTIKYAFYKADKITVGEQLKILSDKKNTIDFTDLNLNILIRILKQNNVKTDFADIEKIKESAIKEFKIN